MSAFREQIRQDNKSVFLNLDEFASEHVVSSQDFDEPTTIKAVVQNETVGNSGMADTLHDLQPGLYGQRLFVSYAIADAPQVPVFGQTIQFDGLDYLVAAVAKDVELVTLELVANER